MNKLFKLWGRGAAISLLCLAAVLALYVLLNRASEAAMCVALVSAGIPASNYGEKMDSAVQILLVPSALLAAAISFATAGPMGYVFAGLSAMLMVSVTGLAADVLARSLREQELTVYLLIFPLMGIPIGGAWFLYRRARFLYLRLSRTWTNAT